MSHIPVVLLTALGDEKNMLEGLEIGADAYITKPFSVGILKATIKNLLANRALLRQVYNSIEEEEQNFLVNCTNTLDWKFIASVKECIEKNMGDPDFNVEMLSSRHHMSRTSFFNKLKVLTGYQLQSIFGSRETYKRTSVNQWRASDTHVYLFCSIIIQNLHIIT